MVVAAAAFVFNAPNALVILEEVMDGVVERPVIVVKYPVVAIEPEPTRIAPVPAAA